jgi:glycosyltransferase involved in cell wall biosynthesis
MKILLVHNEYRELGGEEKVVEAETRLLRENGIEVQEVRFRSAELQGLLSKVRTAWELPHSEQAKWRVAWAIKNFKPDLMHVHNFFPLATPSVFEAAREAGVPSLMTLHNYRIFCANGLLLRDGKPCELCLSDGPKHAVRYRCYQKSLVGSIALARLIYIHQKKRTWHELVDKFIVLTDFSKSRYMKAGLPAHKFVVKPNFLFEPGGEVKPLLGGKPKVLFVGRLSEEKGLSTLLSARALGGEYELHIVGDGPMAPLVKSAAEKDSGIHWHGRLDAPGVYSLMNQASLLVFPSECYENFPIVLLEAMAHGRAMLASRIGGIPEIIIEGTTGELFEPGNSGDLARQIIHLIKDPKAMDRFGKSARAFYLENFVPNRNYQQLKAIYDDLLRKAKSA